MHGKSPRGKPFDICEPTIRFALRAKSFTIRLIDQAA
ncbi:MAG: hypothetical protein FD180_2444 [Planctomycetota bacterium]|nr:MAG: hypothetical protein FD180_2444 [Planctomycetota bacterium]